MLPTFGVVGFYLYRSESPASRQVLLMGLLGAFVALNVICVYLRMKVAHEKLARAALLLILGAGCAYLLVRGSFLNSFGDPEEVISSMFYFSCGAAVLNLATHLFYKSKT